MTLPYSRKQRGTKELLDESKRGEWKIWLKLNIQKPKIMASSPITWWQISQFSPLVVSNSLGLHGLQHNRLPCPSPIPRACSKSCSWSCWCHPTISSSVVPFSCLHFFPASGSFLRSELFASGGQSIGASAAAPVLPMNIQDWFPLGWTGWISLQSKGLLRAFFNTRVQKHQFFGAQLSL